MFRLLGRDSLARLLAGDLTVTDFYNALYATLALSALTILGISISADLLGQNWVNVVIIPVWVLAVMWLKYYPRTLAGTLAVSTAARAAGLIPSITAGFEKWFQLANHVALFGGVFGLTRFLVPIKDHPFMGMVLLAAVITLGLWAWIYGGGHAYKRYVLLLILVALAVGLFGAFAGKSTSGGGMRGVWADYNYKRSFDLELVSFQDTKVPEVCGLKLGTRKFMIPSNDRDRTWVEVPGEASVDISSSLRLNGTWPDETFEVTNEKGCVKVTFALNPAFKNKAITPRIIRFIVV